MIVACPTCNATVEFRYDDSLARVCDHCHATVVRSDRGVESLGQVADLVPLQSPLQLFAEGSYFGRRFMLIGVAQLEHSAGGLWQEWYAKFDDGRWGWIAEHQGRYTVAFEVPGAVNLPSHASLQVGKFVDLGAGTLYKVAEIGHARFRGVRGELPFRLHIDEPVIFADLSDGTGGFATLDFGPDGKAATLYAGKWVELPALGLVGGEALHATTAAKAGQTLVCPDCNANVELRVPEASLRVVCAYCNALLSTEHGTLALLERLRTRLVPTLPLGTKVALPAGEHLVIGFMRRRAYIEYQWWPFDEYLLHHPARGFVWLVESDGHWSLAEPVDPGAVTQHAGGGMAYGNHVFKSFQSATLEVEAVYGEFYWRVAAGERVVARDYVAPPAMLSIEQIDQEQNVSLSRYLTPAEVQAMTGVTIPDRRRGVAPHQPPRLPHVGMYTLITLALLIGMAIVGAGRANTRQVAKQSLVVPRGKPPLPSLPAALTAELPPGTPKPTAEEAPGHVAFSPSFELDGRDNVQIRLETNLANNWAYVIVDLFNEQTGAFTSISHDLEYYRGVDGGESWSEGASSKRITLPPLPKGTYVARLEAVHGGTGQAEVVVQVTIWQGVFRARWFWLAFVLAGLIGGIAYGIQRAYEKRRWADSGFYGPPAPDDNEAAHYGDDEEDDDV